MKTTDILEAMAKGATPCLEHTPEGECYWLEPRRTIIRSDQAKSIIALPAVEPGGDCLIDDETPQTWRIRR